jgi:hypothetical protein
VLSSPRADQAEGLRDLLQKTELSGTRRRALLLHTDRLPPHLAKPHHQRLVRDAIASLAMADRAQNFELTRGRVAVVWRDRDGKELETVMAAIGHLLADLPDGQELPLGQLATVYDLPEQADWLLDELRHERGHVAPGAAGPSRPLDIAMLVRLEQTLAQADVSRFVRWRSVLRLGGGARATAWDERYVAAHEVAATLCPEYRVKADPWLFRRLTRCFDRRMLATLSAAHALRDGAPFALNLNVASILAPEFLRFDAALPASLRGGVTLNLDAADILSDPASFLFARNFARARAYRLLLRNASASLLSLFDVGSAELDFVEVPLTQSLTASPDTLRLLLPPQIAIVVTGLSTQAQLAWAESQSFAFARCS